MRKTFPDARSPIAVLGSAQLTGTSDWSMSGVTLVFKEPAAGDAYVTRTGLWTTSISRVGDFNTPPEPLAIFTARELRGVCDSMRELLHACELMTRNAPEVAKWLKANDPNAFAQVEMAIVNATEPKDAR